MGAFQVCIAICKKGPAMTDSRNERRVRVSDRTYQSLRKLSVQRGESMLSLVDRAVEQYRREQLFSEAEIAYQTLEADPGALAELEFEYSLWEPTVADGLEHEEWDAPIGTPHSP